MIAVIIIACLVILLDQTSKIIISNQLINGQSLKVINNFFYLSYCRNDGIAWGLDVPLAVLIIITIVAIGLFVFFSLKVSWKKDKWLAFTIGFMFGGCIGNFIDRIFQSDHSVIDFLDFLLYYPSFNGGFHFETYDFPIFNIADSFLVVGAIMFIIYVIFIEPKKNKKDETKTSEEEKEEIVNV